MLRKRLLGAVIVREVGPFSHLGIGAGCLLANQNALWRILIAGESMGLSF